MAAAGLPLDSSQVAAAAGPGPPAPVTAASPMAQRAGGFDALTSREPATPLGSATPPADPVTEFRARAAQSPNPFVREVAALLPDYLE